MIFHFSEHFFTKSFLFVYCAGYSNDQIINDIYFINESFSFVYCADFHLSIHAGRTAWAVRASIYNI